MKTVDQTMLIRELSEEEIRKWLGIPAEARLESVKLMDSPTKDPRRPDYGKSVGFRFVVNRPVIGQVSIAYAQEREDPETYFKKAALLHSGADQLDEWAAQIEKEPVLRHLPFMIGIVAGMREVAADYRRIS